MYKFYCDRCGKEIKNDDVFKFEIPLLGAGADHVIKGLRDRADLCETCALAACRFIKNKEVEEVEQEDDDD